MQPETSAQYQHRFAQAIREGKAAEQIAARAVECLYPPDTQQYSQLYRPLLYRNAAIL